MSGFEPFTLTGDAPPAPGPSDLTIGEPIAMPAMDDEPSPDVFTAELTTAPDARAEDEAIDPTPVALLATRVHVADGAVFLKLFMPPLFDGAYLAFDGAGEARGVISAEAAHVLERATGTAVDALTRDDAGICDPHALQQVIALLASGLLVAGDGNGQAHWIRPDAAPGTRHAGSGADRFIRLFYDYFGDVFRDGSALIDSHGDFLQAIANYFPTTPGLSCVDLGCGSGHYTATLARLGHRVVAVDISQARLDATAAKDVGAGTIVPLLADIERVPLPDAGCDFVMCNFVLEHVADHFAVVDEMIRLLRPGGRLLIAIPGFNVRDNLGYWMFGEAPSLNFEHLRSFGLFPGTHPWCAPLTDLLEKLRASGVQVLRMEGCNILDGLGDPWRSEFAAAEARLGTEFAITWPWNAQGRQTVIVADKPAS